MGAAFLTNVAPIAVMLTLEFWGAPYDLTQFRVYRSSGSFGQYVAENASDGRPNTWWTPRNRSGASAYLSLCAPTTTRIDAIEIWPGSHEPNFTGYGNLFPLNSRLKRARIEFSDDGPGFEIELEDADKMQRFTFAARTVRCVQLHVLETRPGSQWNDLCISEIRVLRRRDRFRHNSLRL